MQFTNISKLFDEENWIILPTVDSTNTFAKEILSKSKPILNGTVIMAVEQTAGRGQKNNSWYSEPGKNLTFSIILDTSFLPIQRQFALNQAISLGILDFFQKYAHLPSLIKWPNDVYIGEFKIAGILIENLIVGERHKHSIIGIGININQSAFPPGVKRATSLFLETKMEFLLTSILAKVLKEIAIRLDQLVSPKAFFLEEDYQNNLLGRGQLRYFRHHDQIFQGIIKGVNESGELIITIQGSEKAFGLHELFLYSKSEIWYSLVLHKNVSFCVQTLTKFLLNYEVTLAIIIRRVSGRSFGICHALYISIIAPYHKLFY